MDHLVELTAEESLSLLATQQVGRLALMTPAGLRIFPVNYTVHGDDVVFRTLPYGVIANSAHRAEVAFEVDQIDGDTESGWSVVVAGTCERIDDHGEVTFVRQQGDPMPWAAGTRTLYFRIQLSDITGRQVGLAQRPSLIPGA